MAANALRTGRHGQMRSGLFFQVTNITTRRLSRVIKRNVQIPRRGALVAHAAIHASGCHDVCSRFTNGTTGNKLTIVARVATR